MTLIFTVIVFTISHKTYNHRCQCKQMHRKYFRITTALCYLTAVLLSTWSQCFDVGWATGRTSNL